MKNTKSLLMRLNEKVHEDFKVATIKEKTTMQAKLEEWVEMYLRGELK